MGETFEYFSVQINTFITFLIVWHKIHIVSKHEKTLNFRGNIDPLQINGRYIKDITQDGTNSTVFSLLCINTYSQETAT